MITDIHRYKTDIHGFTDMKSVLLEPELSYKIRGCIYNVANKYGRGLKEQVYQNALAEELKQYGIRFEEQKRINIYSIATGKVLGVYTPDFVAENKVIIEIKASSITTKNDLAQQLSYLKASVYEIAFLVNFGTSRLDIRRSIYTNDRKSFVVKLSAKEKSVTPCASV